MAPKRILNSYTSGISFPAPEIIDIVKERWSLDLLNIDSKPQAESLRTLPSEVQRLSLFDQPIKLTNGGLEIVLERKGAGVAVGITVSRNLKRA